MTGCREEEVMIEGEGRRKGERGEESQKYQQKKAGDL